MGGKSTAAATGPDNNKRLAALEGGVSSLAVALSANGIAVADGADPIELAIAAVKARSAALETNEQLVKTNETQAAVIGELNIKIGELEKAAAGGSGNATDGEIAAIARAEAAEKANLEAEQELENLRKDVLDLEERIDVLQAAAVAGAPAAVNEEPRTRPEQARDLGPTFGNMDREQLVELIGNDAGFEIAFSNGDHEIVGLEPQPITARQLRAGADGQWIVDVPLFIRGGNHREDIAGASLVFGGEQAAYCAFPSPVSIEPGQERRFDRQFIF